MCKEAWDILAEDFDYQPKTDDTHNYSTMGINLTTMYNSYSGFGRRTERPDIWVLTPKAFVEFYLANSEYILGAKPPGIPINLNNESEFNMKIAQTQYNYMFSIINLGDEDTAQSCVQSGEIMGRNARHIMNQLLQRYNDLDFDKHRVDLKRLAGDGVCD
jgi:hypothetical protein